MHPTPPILLTLAVGLAAGCNSSPSTGQVPSAATAPAATRTARPAAAPATATAAATVTRIEPAAVRRIAPEQARARVAAGALLVCAYGDRSKCGGLGIAGGMAWADFAERIPDLEKDQEIIFYCA